MKYFALFLMLSSLGLGKPSDLLAKALRDEDLTAVEKSDLVKLTYQDPKGTLKLLKGHLPADLEREKNNLTTMLETIPFEDQGWNRAGAAIGWFFQFEGDQMSSLPFISKLHEGSPAAEAGMRRGDVIYSAEGIVLYDAESRNRFINLLWAWPTDVPLNLILYRNPAHNEEGDMSPRHKKVEVSIVLKKAIFRK